MPKESVLDKIIGDVKKEAPSDYSFLLDTVRNFLYKWDHLQPLPMPHRNLEVEVNILREAYGQAIEEK